MGKIIIGKRIQTANSYDLEYTLILDIPVDLQPKLGLTKEVPRRIGVSFDEAFSVVKAKLEKDLYDSQIALNTDHSYDFDGITFENSVWSK